MGKIETGIVLRHEFVKFFIEALEGSKMTTVLYNLEYYVRFLLRTIPIE